MHEPRVLLSLPPALGGRRTLALVEPLAVLSQRDGVASCDEGCRRTEVADIAVALEERLADAGAGARAVGFFGYEYGAALDPLIACHQGRRDLPDAWWAVLPARPRRRTLELPRWRPAGRDVRLAVSLDDAAFRRGVERIREMIAAGGVYQVNLTRRWTAASPPSPAGLFGHLCGSAPPRFGAYVEDREQGWAVLCLSPELLLRRRGAVVETRPIKGTRPRAGGAAAVAAELRASDKDRAELAMIVDLERNDLNRVCVPGSVRVTRRAGTLLTRDVVHLEAGVRGHVRPRVTLRELLAAVFPGGSVTGAPKIAACRAIAELEPVPRSVYCGALGVVRAGGDCTLALPIRTGYVTGGELHFHSGGGIVFDSDADAEERESRAKVRSWLDALEGQ